MKFLFTVSLLCVTCHASRVPKTKSSVPFERTRPAGASSAASSDQPSVPPNPKSGPASRQQLARRQKLIQRMQQKCQQRMKMVRKLGGSQVIKKYWSKQPSTHVAHAAQNDEKTYKHADQGNDAITTMSMSDKPRQTRARREPNKSECAPRRMSHKAVPKSQATSQKKRKNPRKRKPSQNLMGKLRKDFKKLHDKIPESTYKILREIINSAADHKSANVYNDVKPILLWVSEQTKLHEKEFQRKCNDQLKEILKDLIKHTKRDDAMKRRSRTQPHGSSRSAKEPKQRSEQEIKQLKRLHKIKVDRMFKLAHLVLKNHEEKDLNRESLKKLLDETQTSPCYSSRVLEFLEGVASTIDLQPNAVKKVNEFMENLANVIANDDFYKSARPHRTKPWDELMNRKERLVREHGPIDLILELNDELNKRNRIRDFGWDRDSETWS